MSFRVFFRTLSACALAILTQEFYCFSDFEHLPEKHYEYEKVCLMYPDHGYSATQAWGMTPTYDYDSKVGYPHCTSPAFSAFPLLSK